MLTGLDWAPKRSRESSIIITLNSMVPVLRGSSVAAARDEVPGGMFSPAKKNRCVPNDVSSNEGKTVANLCPFEPVGIHVDRPVLVKLKDAGYDRPPINRNELGLVTPAIICEVSTAFWGNWRRHVTVPQGVLVEPLFA